MTILYHALEWVMNLCYSICRNYGVAIILFTFISKIVLLPVSIWVQKNSIKMVKMQPEINFLKARHFGDKDTIAEEQSKIFKREKYNPMVSIVPLVIQIVLLMGVIEAIKSGMANPEIDMEFLGVHLSLIPSVEGGWLILSPVIAGVSAWLLCIAQNKSNVLQSEQSKINKYGTMIFSLYVGWFVAVGVALYWVASNLMAIIQLYILNWAIDPKKYVDYEELEKSKKALEELGNIGNEHRRGFRDPEAKRERADYKRFFSIVNKHLVFYSESSGFYKYYKGIIEYILNDTNIIIHYITSDPEDAVFELSREQDRLRTYYIGEKKLITMMMKMDADIVVMTMPDLENFHIKRSYVRKDVEYIYVPHGMGSINMTMRTGSVDHYDTVYCVGKHHREEVEKTEQVYGLEPKRIVDWGYSLLDDMRQDYNASKRQSSSGRQVLIAPSWQQDNIVDSCLETILDKLREKDYNIIVRPHPQHVRHKRKMLEAMQEKYREAPNIEIQLDFSSNSTVFEADLMITDWSDISFEYAYTTQKPVLFINTPMKVMNPEYEKIDVVPINILLRDKIGCSVNLDELDTVGDRVDMLLQNADEYYVKIGRFVNEYVYNLGHSAEVGAQYIIGQLQKKSKERKENK